MLIELLKRHREIAVNFSKALDIMLVVIAFIASYYLRRHLSLPSLTGLSIIPNYYLLLLIAMTSCYVSFRFFGFYDQHFSESLVKRFNRVVKGVLGGLGLFIMLLYISHQSNVSRIMVFLFGGILLAFLLIKLFIVNYFISRKGREFYGQNILIVGSRERSRETIKTLKSVSGMGYEVVGCLEMDVSGVGAEVFEGVKVIGTMDDFKNILYEKVIDDVIFAVPLKKIDNISRYLAIATEVGVHVRIMPDWQIQKVMYQTAAADIVFEQLMGLPTLSLSSTPKQNLQLFTKELMDYIGALVGIILLSPILLIISILIKMTSEGPVVFFQERCGLNGRRFKLYKFRTMVADAEMRRQELIGENEQSGPVFKIRNDPRVTRVGRLLRKTSLDELPQLFNVLKGEMSLVGPRPPIPSEVEKYEPWQRRRLSMKPGITCIWQVSGRNDTSFDNWMKMDLEYIDNWSLLLDLKLMLLTIRAVFMMTGH